MPRQHGMIENYKDPSGSFCERRSGLKAAPLRHYKKRGRTIHRPAVISKMLEIA